MKNTILFDLDGTLLPMDNDVFLKTYVGSISKYFSDIVDPMKFSKALLEASELTIRNGDQETNDIVYMKYFGELLGVNTDEYYQKFYDYYDHEFDICKQATKQSEEIIKAVSILKEKGYDIVIATNPLLPLKANLKRIQWAGLDPNDFLHITSFEGCTSCKPRKEFYIEILNEIGKTVEECIMVGNDTIDDLSVSQIGMETYLITDCIINHSNELFKPTNTGSYHDFLGFVRSLKTII